MAVPSKKGDETLVWIDNARILAIFAVVMLHVSADVVSEAEVFGSWQWWAGNLYDSMVRWCVPVFVMISGALLLSDSKNEPARDFYKKRMAKVMFPLLFWSMFYLGWTCLKEAVKGKTPSLEALGIGLLAGRPYFHMWFMFMIVGLYFLTPYLRILLLRITGREVQALVAVLFALSAANALNNSLGSQSAALFSNLFLPFVPYFIFGQLFNRTGVKPGLLVSASVFVGSGLATAIGFYLLGLAYGIAKGIYLYSYLSLTVIPMSISALCLLRRIEAPLLGSGATGQFAGLIMGIYFVHPLIKEIFKHAGLHPLGFNPLVSIPIISLLLILVSGAIVWAIGRIPFLWRIV